MTGGSDDVRPPKGAPRADEDAPEAPAKEADSERSGAGSSARAVSGPLPAVGVDRLARPKEEMDRLMGASAKPSIFAPPQTRTPKKTPTFTAPKIPSSEKAPSVAGPKVPGASERSGIAPPPTFGTMSKVKAPRAKTECGLPAVDEAEPEPKTKPAETKAKPAESEPEAKSPEPAQPKAKSPEPKPEPAQPEAKSSEPKAKPAQPEPAQPKAKSPEPKAKPAEPKAKPSLRVVSDDESEPAKSEPAKSEPAKSEPAKSMAPARASRPAEPIPAALDTGHPPSGPPWALIGVGALALAVGGYFILRDGSPSPDPAPIAKASVETLSPTPTVTPTSAAGATPTPTPMPSDDGADAQDTAATGPAPAPGDSGGAEPALPVTRSGDPREPPPGTSPEVAAVFRRLPVSPSDGPPIGGIGANGIHIDELRMGADVSRGCADSTTRFSVVAQDRAGVCVRVVHPREKDELQVLWQKHGGYTRRSKMVVLPKHAYRTRGHLKLRKEYIGDWTVRILSSDGVELAHHEFTIVP